MVEDVASVDRNRQNIVNSALGVQFFERLFDGSPRWYDPERTESRWNNPAWKRLYYDRPHVEGAPGDDDYGARRRGAESLERAGSVKGKLREAHDRTSVLRCTQALLITCINPECSFRVQEFVDFRSRTWISRSREQGWALASPGNRWPYDPLRIFGSLQQVPDGYRQHAQHLRNSYRGMARGEKRDLELTCTTCNRWMAVFPLVPITNKWIYVLSEPRRAASGGRRHQITPYAEIRMAPSARARQRFAHGFRMITPHGRESFRRGAWSPFRAQMRLNRAAERTFHFFLSPVPLGDEALRMLCSPHNIPESQVEGLPAADPHIEGLQPWISTIRLNFPEDIDADFEVIPLIDPFSWVSQECVHNYMPALESQNALQKSKEEKCKLFIASVLSQLTTPRSTPGDDYYDLLITRGDPWDLRDNLLPPPDSADRTIAHAWIQRYRDTAGYLSRQTDAACLRLLLALCRSPGFKVVEKACHAFRDPSPESEFGEEEQQHFYHLGLSLWASVIEQSLKCPRGWMFFKSVNFQEFSPFLADVKSGDSVQAPEAEGTDERLSFRQTQSLRILLGRMPVFFSDSNDPAQQLVENMNRLRLRPETVEQRAWRTISTGNTVIKYGRELLTNPFQTEPLTLEKLLPHLASQFVPLDEAGEAITRRDAMQFFLGELRTLNDFKAFYDAFDTLKENPAEAFSDFTSALGNCIPAVRYFFLPEYRDHSLPGTAAGSARNDASMLNVGRNHPDPDSQQSILGRIGEMIGGEEPASDQLLREREALRSFFEDVGPNMDLPATIQDWSSSEAQHILQWGGYLHEEERLLLKLELRQPLSSAERMALQHLADVRALSLLKGLEHAINGPLSIVTSSVEIMSGARSINAALASGDQGEAAAGWLELGSSLFGLGIAIEYSVALAFGASAVLAGPLGWISGALLLGSALVSYFCKRNDFETFASFCFLGNLYGQPLRDQSGVFGAHSWRPDNDHPLWMDGIPFPGLCSDSQERFPAESPHSWQKQLKVLLNLLCMFETRILRSDPPSLLIIPGYLPERAFYEIEIVLRPRRQPETTEVYRLKTWPHEGRSQWTGRAPTAAEVAEIRVPGRESQKTIKIAARPRSWTEETVFEWHVRLHLSDDDRRCVPPGAWVVRKSEEVGGSLARPGEGLYAAPKLSNDSSVVVEDGSVEITRERLPDSQLHHW